MTDDDLTLPAFLDRRFNGIVSDLPAATGGVRRATKQKLVWPKKKNWRKIEQQRREREKREDEKLRRGQ